ncbi:MAG: hypothetical protein F4152_04370 [Dehalococcoidia bacterium]|nr:hypothetical protein [Dehalococcoidia bacterium]
MTTPRYGIAEWYGRPFTDLSPEERSQLAEHALKADLEPPPSPFQPGQPTCSKRGGVCSMQRYEDDEGRIGSALGIPTAFGPRRFGEGQVLVRWLAEVVGFSEEEAMVAREVPFMLSTNTSRPAGKIDLVVGRVAGEGLVWYGLEIQAVYFSGNKMELQFQALRDDQGERPPFPDRRRGPDWRSSGPKRLMPQLQVKVPTLRRWGSKMAVAVDRAFFDKIGGPSPVPSQDLGDGDIIWLVPEIKSDGRNGFQLARGHWEVLTLEASEDKLLAADALKREAFEQSLRARLEPLE